MNNKLVIKSLFESIYKTIRASEELKGSVELLTAQTTVILTSLLVSHGVLSVLREPEIAKLLEEFICEYENRVLLSELTDSDLVVSHTNDLLTLCSRMKAHDYNYHFMVAETANRIPS
ncbi:hypothetical protein L1D34_27615 [Vibrio mediterranei]|uniref:hypothetical protein n=1 Tax=Vibrio mediterranei TaxID=689 RepID=UPI001EFD1E34|nr:hypothetical protein [Vibrio mediterranei]MCG9628583.1 hypothetical protein [Vibrio mediterranei]